MAYLGLVPSEHSSGPSVRRGGLTKPAPGGEQGAGNNAARRLLIEAAWCYRFPARVSREHDHIQGRRQQTSRQAATGQAWRRSRGQENPRYHYLPGHWLDAGR